NADRIVGMGFAPQLFETVMTSGEALWRDVKSSTVPAGLFYPIERSQGDAALWADGLSVDFTADIQMAEGVLLMGLPDGSTLDDWRSKLNTALAQDLTIYCSNPDRTSPRKDGFVVSPGALAFAYQDMGGTTVFYGKPHRPIFASVEAALGTDKLLMIGDSLEHDIAGAAASHWDSVLVQGGLYAKEFAGADPDQVLSKLISENDYIAPTFRMEMVQ
ncbi:MAG: HAD-IA family hydrolase, partial [Pseudomonadota bacterium]